MPAASATPAPPGPDTPSAPPAGEPSTEPRTVRGSADLLATSAAEAPDDPASSAVELAGVLAESGARVVVADDSAVKAVRAAVLRLDEAGPRPRIVVVAARPGPAAAPTT